MTFENSENSTIFEQINIMRFRTRRAKFILYSIVLLWYEKITKLRIFVWTLLSNIQVSWSPKLGKSTKSKGLLKRRWSKLISHFSPLLVFWGSELSTWLSQSLWWLVDADFVVVGCPRFCNGWLTRVLRIANYVK